MSRTYAIAMTRPHERFQIPLPLGRRLPQGVVGWNMLIAAVSIALACGYVVQVNRAAARGFNLREAEKKIEHLQIEVTSLNDTVATLSSLQSLSERATQLGFVPIDRLEFANPAAKSYAMAR